MDIAASKTGAVSILEDFSGYVRSDPGDCQWIFVIGTHGLIPWAERITDPGQIKDEAGIRVIERPDVKRSWGARLKFEFFTGKSFIDSLKPDVVFSMENTMPHIRTGIKKVLYVHQPLGYQDIKRFSLFNKEERHFAVYQHFISRLIDASVRRSDTVIVQTRWMRSAVIKKTGVGPEKVYAILPPLPEIPDGLKRRPFDPKTFIFPSGPIVYKNHECVIKAVHILREKGITDLKVIFTLTEEEAGERLANMAADLKENLEWRGRMERRELFEAYTSSVLIFPSYIETYGYPPAEARSVGGAVLASDTPFCREVLEGYPRCWFFHPFRPQELAELIERVMSGQMSPEIVCPETSPAGSAWGEVVKVVTA